IIDQGGYGSVTADGGGGGGGGYFGGGGGSPSRGGGGGSGYIDAALFDGAFGSVADSDRLSTFGNPGRDGMAVLILP
uniref:hypothetical protein n=1 Tax=Azospirillum sp. ST 5-10 TaxID=3445776 RepID=UPI003F4A8068